MSRLRRWLRQARVARLRRHATCLEHGFPSTSPAGRFVAAADAVAVRRQAAELERTL